MPHTPLRHLKPELFTDEQQKMNFLAIEDADSETEMLNESDVLEDINDDFQDQNSTMEDGNETDEEEGEETTHDASDRDDVVLLAMDELVHVHREDEC